MFNRVETTLESKFQVLLGCLLSFIISAQRYEKRWKAFSGRDKGRALKWRKTQYGARLASNAIKGVKSLAFSPTPPHIKMNQSSPRTARGGGSRRGLKPHFRRHNLCIQHLSGSFSDSGFLFILLYQYIPHDPLCTTINLHHCHDNVDAGQN